MRLADRVRQIGTLHDRNTAAHEKLEEDLQKIMNMLAAKPCAPADIKADLNLSERQWRRRRELLIRRGLMEAEVRTITAPTGRYRARQTEVGVGLR